MSPSNSNGGSSTVTVGVNGNGNNKKKYIEHQVSKTDTLAGVAIKYGVEVADIKRLNGLGTDLQMFALKILLIPLPGRHPPSPILSDISASDSGGKLIDKTPQHLCDSNRFEPFASLRLKSSQRNTSPAMTTLQKYYGLESAYRKDVAEGAEMAVYKTGSSDYLNEGLLPKASPISGPPYHNHKSRYLTNSLLPENGALGDYMSLAEARDAEAEKLNEKSVRRRQKAEGDSRTGTPEKLLKEETSGGSSGFSPVTGKSLAMRPKSASRAALATESEPGWLNSIPIGLGDSITADGLAGVHKSSSTPSLQDQETINSSSVWQTSKWSLKPDLQALSTSAITIPIFDGLPKPISGRRSKAALD